MPSARPRESKNPYRRLALHVLVRGLLDHHWRWFYGEWGPTPCRPGGGGTVELWCDMAELELSPLLKAVRLAHEEFLWDLAARAIKRDMEERA